MATKKFNEKSAGRVVALIAAGTMGFAIQHGATCTVAAVDEIGQRRKISRLSAMLEAAKLLAVWLRAASAGPVRV